MNESDATAAAYGRERLCPHCGARVAQKAETCFFCGGLLTVVPRRRRRLPWSDLLLFVFIAGVLAVWWFYAPTAPVKERFDQTVTAAAIAARPTAARPRRTVSEPTATPSPTATPPSTPTPAPTPIRHIVAAGESFGIIGDKYGFTAKEIAEANGMTVNDVIHPGQELLIPAPKDGSAPLPTPTPTGGTLLYTVRAGDTLSEIAERFDSRLEWILEANKRKLTDMLRPGDRLLIPLSGHTPTPTISPTPTMTPAPSPTSELMLRPPALLSPAHNATLPAGGEVILRWAASAVLAKDQWYVVTVQPLDSDASIAPYWTKSTQWRFPAEYRDPDRAVTRFAWQVQVFVGEPGQEDGRPISPPSEERVFGWGR